MATRVSKNDSRREVKFAAYRGATAICSIPGEPANFESQPRHSTDTVQVRPCPTCVPSPQDSIEAANTKAGSASVGGVNEWSGCVSGSLNLLNDTPFLCSLLSLVSRPPESLSSLAHFSKSPHWLQPILHHCSKSQSRIRASPSSEEP